MYNPKVFSIYTDLCSHDFNYFIQSYHMWSVLVISCVHLAEGLQGPSTL